MRDILSHRQIFDAITVLRQTGKQIFLLTTGSTGGLAEALWQPFHASSQLMGHHFCYAQEDLVRFLGFKPKQFCSEETAAQMAAHAYWHGMELAVRRGIAVPDMIGVGMTSVVSSDRHHRGEERVHIAVRTKENFLTFKAVFSKCDENALQEERYQTRIDQSQLADVMTLNVILQALHLEQIPFLNVGVEQGNFYEVHAGLVVMLVSMLHDGTPQGPVRNLLPAFGKVYRNDCVSRVHFAKDADLSRCVLMSGSFNPLHHGHLKLARTIEEMTGKRVVFEITTTHPDKGRIPVDEMMRRTDQFLMFAPVILTDNAPLFIDKARQYPGVPMVVGADVMQGILDKRHYGDSLKNLFDVLDEFISLGTVFYVNGREVDGLFLTRDDVPVPKRYENLFLAVSGRTDISSSELRAKAQA